MMANMKREADFDTGGMEGGKRSRGVGRVEARVLVPSRMAGSVIGKGGANIQKLWSEYSAGVRIPDCPGPERIMSVQVRDQHLPQCLLHSNAILRSAH